MQTFRFRQCDVAYRAEGSGPAMVLLNNGGASHRIWDRQVDFFSSRVTVYALDLLGFGESAKPDVAYDLGGYRQLLDRWTVIEKTGHMAMNEAPDQGNALVLGFPEDVERGTPAGRAMSA